MHRKSDDDQRQYHGGEIQHENEPALHHDEEVERLLRPVDEFVVLLNRGITPAKSTQCGEAGEGFEKLCVDGGLFFEVEETKLAGGAEVAALEVEVEGGEEGESNGNVVG